MKELVDGAGFGELWHRQTCKSVWMGGDRHGDGRNWRQAGGLGGGLDGRREAGDGWWLQWGWNALGMEVAADEMKKKLRKKKKMLLEGGQGALKVKGKYPKIILNPQSL